MTQMKSEWQPIETAPKDGTAVLLWGGQYEDDLNGPRDNEIISYAHFVPDDFDEGDPGRWEELGGCYYSSWIHNPTHWHPVPPPPPEVK
jgi:hypothetical protein